MNDASYFKAYVEHFRGETPTDVIRPASNWRLLVPLLASPLPFDPLSSLNLINLLCVAASIPFLFFSVLKISASGALSWLGCWLFIFSFPTFYYSTIGYVDPGVMLCTAAVLYFTLCQNRLGVFLFFALGCLAKETIVLVIPFVVGYNWFHSKKQTVVVLFLLAAVYIVLNLLLRHYAYITPGQLNPSFWKFSTSAVIQNVYRLNSWLAPVLSFGIPGLLLSLQSYRVGIDKIRQSTVLLASWIFVFGAFALTLISATATFCDGRMMWQASYAMIIGVAASYTNE